MLNWSHPRNASRILAHQIRHYVMRFGQIESRTNNLNILYSIVWALKCWVIGDSFRTYESFMKFILLTNTSTISIYRSWTVKQLNSKLSKRFKCCRAVNGLIGNWLMSVSTCACIFSSKRFIVLCHFPKSISNCSCLKSKYRCVNFHNKLNSMNNTWNPGDHSLC